MKRLMRVPVAGRVVLVMVLSCWSAADAAQRFVDLTYTFDETTQVWPATNEKSRAVRRGT